MQFYVVYRSEYLVHFCHDDAGGKFLQYADKRRYE